jgi:nitrogen fixation protein NifU and related proteins
MSYLNELYQEIILDHNKRPRNYCELREANRKAEGFNPLCGDKVTVYLRLEDDVIQEISFSGCGCAISTASASLMTEVLKGRTVTDVEAMFRRFHGLVTGKEGAQEASDLGKLQVFQGVSEYPVRVKCATLAWHTLQAALNEKKETISTE